MPQDYRTIYNTWLLDARIAVLKQDRAAAMFALSQAMVYANKVHDNRFRKAVFRAMSFTRRIPSQAI